jgi:hypothetical protein
VAVLPSVIVEPLKRGKKMKTNKNVETSHSERGQSIVEFGVGMVVLIILLAGIVDGGRALFTYMAIREAAQEGALFGSTDPTQTSMIVSRAENASDLIRDLANTPKDPSDPSGPGAIDVKVEILGGACVGNGIRVTVTYDQFPITTPFLGAALGRQTIGISASATDTILTPPCP